MSARTTPEFVCGYCHKMYRQETSFLKHECDQMKRSRALQSPTGQAAYMYYQEWMSQLHRARPSIEAFADSKNFWTFVKFVEFARKVSLANNSQFIRLMIELDFQPQMWTMDVVYAKYIDYLDKRYNPMDQLNDSVMTLMKIADAADVDVSEIFTILEPHEITHLVRVRHLSPWLLLHSTKFKEYFRDNMNIEQRVGLEALINPETWIHRFETRTDVVEVAKRYLAEMGL